MCVYVVLIQQKICFMLRSCNFQCIPAKYLVPVIKAIGRQLEVLNVRLHMQVSSLFNA